MKKIALMFLGCLVFHAAHADSSAYLHIKISDPLHDNRYFICMNNVGGCVSITQGDHGKIYPVAPGKVNYVTAIDVVNRNLSHQPLPKSCQLTLNNQQTMTITGKLVEDKNKKIYIQDIKCSV